MWQLKFPREVAFPKRRLMNTAEEFVAFVNANVGLLNLYTTVYNYGNFSERYGVMRPDYQSAVIDRIYFDCDNYVHANGGTIEVDGFDSMRKIHEWCMDRNIMHMCCSTGSAYNVIMAVDAGEPKNKSGCVYNAQKFLLDELDVMTDPQVMGDIARVTRIPNTFNFKPSAQRYVRCLDDDDIKKGPKGIAQMSSKQGPWKVIGQESWDIREHDCEPRQRFTVDVDVSKLNAADMGMPDNIPDCIKSMASNGDMRFKERPMLIMWLRDHGYTLEETIGILKKCLAPKTYKHCVFEERQPQYIYSRALDLFMPKCETIRGLGYCSLANTCDRQ